MPIARVAPLPVTAATRPSISRDFAGSFGMRSSRNSTILVTAFEVASPMIVFWKFELVMLVPPPAAAPLMPSTPL